MSELVYSNSHAAGDAYRLVSRLQLTFVNGLETVARSVGMPCEMHNSEWFRDQGSHGGGNRFGLTGPLFNRSSVNISQVHYDDLPGKKLGSATALSTIIHPNNPLAPSLHLHLSWTEFKNKTGFWRLMADLNPAIEDSHATQTFNNCLKTVASKSYLEASLQGDRYFYIPVLKRHRGVAHFYLEGYQTERPRCFRASGHSLLLNATQTSRHTIGRHHRSTLPTTTGLSHLIFSASLNTGSRHNLRITHP